MTLKRTPLNTLFVNHQTAKCAFTIRCSLITHSLARADQRPSWVSNSYVLTTSAATGTDVHWHRDRSSSLPTLQSAPHFIRVVLLSFCPSFLSVSGETSVISGKIEACSVRRTRIEEVRKALTCSRDMHSPFTPQDVVGS